MPVRIECLLRIDVWRGHVRFIKLRIDICVSVLDVYDDDQATGRLAARQQRWEHS